MQPDEQSEEAAGEVLTAVNHPTLGRITDPREAHLAGIAEGLKLGYRFALDEPLHGHKFALDELLREIQRA